MTPVTKTALGLAGALLLAAGLGAGAATAAPIPTSSLPTPVEAHSQAGIALASGKICYPRIRWIYRPGIGFRQVIAGWICIPYLVQRPFRIPGPPERIGGPRVVLR